MNKKKSICDLVGNCGKIRDATNFRRFLAGSRHAFHRAFWENRPRESLAGEGVRRRSSPSAGMA